MSWLIAGTVPDDGFGLAFGPAQVTGQDLVVKGKRVSIARGTPAVVARACLECGELGIEGRRGVLAGDTGQGEGSRALYDYLVQAVQDLDVQGFTFHYLQPDVYWHNQVLWTIREMPSRACLVADAGFMYVAKMSGFAADYDLFTPDVGEMSFLADETAPHPFYTRGFLLEDETKVPEYITRAWAEKNAAQHLLIKGAQDYITRKDEILATVSSPSTEAMEAIGGTGDTLTGLVSAYLLAGYCIPDACCLAALSNRYLGSLARPTPATLVSDLLPFLPQAMDHACRDHGKPGTGSPV